MNTSLLSALFAASTTIALAAPAPPEDGKLRIICFGAHPDDCEIQAGGVGAMWAAKGHHVKLVSVTNGDIGHWREAGGPLARRRKAEAEKADQILGVTTEVLDIHDGELMPTLENRRTITRLIREWKADIVIQSSQRLSSRSPLHVHFGAGLGLHGHSPILYPECAAGEEKSRIPLHAGPVPASESLPGRCRRGN